MLAWSFRLADVVKGTAKPKGHSSHSSASSSSSASKDKEAGSSPRTVTPPPQTSQATASSTSTAVSTASSQSQSQPHHHLQVHTPVSHTSTQPCVHSGTSTSSGNDSVLATVAMTPPSSPEKYVLRFHRKNFSYSLRDESA